MKRSIFSCIAVLALLIWGSEAKAVPIQDQAFDGPNFGVSTIFDLAQTFTVGVDGILSSVEAKLRVCCGGSALPVEIRSTSSGVPVDAPALGSITVAGPGSGSSFTSFDFSSFAIPVTIGDVLAIVARGGISWNSSAASQSVPLYGPGQAWIRSGPAGNPWVTVASNFSSFGDQDFHFKTFVEPIPVPVPVPATLLLFSSGLVGMAALRRRLTV